MQIIYFFHANKKKKNMLAASIQILLGLKFAIK